MLLCYTHLEKERKNPHLYERSQFQIWLLYGEIIVDSKKQKQKKEEEERKRRRKWEEDETSCKA